MHPTLLGEEEPSSGWLLAILPTDAYHELDSLVRDIVSLVKENEPPIQVKKTKKGLFAGYLYTRKWYMQQKEVGFRVVTHNLRKLPRYAIKEEIEDMGLSR